MPLDATDWEKINDQNARISERIDRVVMSLMPRSEYEARHITVNKRVDELEIRVNTLTEFERQEHKEIMARLEKQFDALIKRIDNLDGDVKEIKEQRTNSQDVTIRSIVGYVVTFILGGGLLGLVQFLLSMKH